MILLFARHVAVLRHGVAIAGMASLTFAGPALAGDDKIVTDRPDFVESSAVVGKGRFQV